MGDERGPWEAPAEAEETDATGAGRTRPTRLMCGSAVSATKRGGRSACSRGCGRPSNGSLANLAGASVVPPRPSFSPYSAALVGCVPPTGPAAALRASSSRAFSSSLASISSSSGPAGSPRGKPEPPESPSAMTATSGDAAAAGDRRRGGDSVGDAGSGDDMVFCGRVPSRSMSTRWAGPSRDCRAWLSRDNRSVNVATAADEPGDADGETDGDVAATECRRTCCGEGSGSCVIHAFRA